MDLVISGLAAPVALGSVALIGYLVARHGRRTKAHHRLELSIKLDQANALIERVEQLSDQLRRSMANHHSTVTNCTKQIQILSDRHSSDTDQAHHMHLQDVLGPTQRLSDDIAHAYDELRQHTRALRSLRHR
jgi:hypothetical protein